MGPPDAQTEVRYLTEAEVIFGTGEDSPVVGVLNSAAKPDPAPLPVRYAPNRRQRLAAGLSRHRSRDYDGPRDVDHRRRRGKRQGPPRIGRSRLVAGLHYIVAADALEQFTRSLLSVGLDTSGATVA